MLALDPDIFKNPSGSEPVPAVDARPRTETSKHLSELALPPSAKIVEHYPGLQTTIKIGDEALGQTIRITLPTDVEN